MNDNNSSGNSNDINNTSVDLKLVKTGFWHLPKVFYAVLLIEFWERFAFYGLQAVAVIYFIKNFNIAESQAGILFSSFSALVYALLTIGGLLGDKILGIRRTYVFGIIFLLVGYTLISFAHTVNTLYFAMGVVVIGNVLFKTNASNYVSRCFESNDPRIDSAFTYFYMSINVGSFASMVLVPIIMQVFGSSVALGMCAFGMLVALLLYVIFYQRFKLADNNTGRNGKNMLLKIFLIVIAALVLSYICSLLLNNLEYSKIALYIISIIVVLIYFYIAINLNKNEAKGMYVALVLLIQSVVFWILYIQTATSMTLFALHNVRLNILSYTLPAGITQSFNGFFIIVLSPILANWYIYQHKKGRPITIPVKFVSGIFITSLCFITLAVAGTFFADNNAQISIIFLVLAYLIYSLGELLVSAIGLSMVSQLLPKRLGGFAQGVWFLCSAIGIKIGGQLSGSLMIDSNADNLTILHAYVKLFYKLGLFACVLALIFTFMLKPLSRSLKQVLENRY